MIARICWAVLGLIHLLPALALFRPAMIGRLYGVEAGSTAFLLLHHRAALFLVVLVVCLWALARPEVRPLASVAVGISMLSFLWLYLAAGQLAALRQIAIADVIGLPFLVVAAWQALRPAVAG